LIAASAAVIFRREVDATGTEGSLEEGLVSNAAASKLASEARTQALAHLAQQVSAMIDARATARKEKAEARAAQAEERPGKKREFLPLSTVVAGCILPEDTQSGVESRRLGFDGLDLEDWGTTIGKQAKLDSTDRNVHTDAVESDNNAPCSTGVVKNLGQLNQLLRNNYNKNKLGPISIIPGKKEVDGETTDVYVVLLAGVEAPSASIWNGVSQADSAATFFDMPTIDRYFRTARYAMRAVIAPGSKVILVGHSNGAVVAQLLAGDETLKEELNIQRAIAFGTPYTPPAKGEVNVELSIFNAVEDPVAAFGESDAFKKACADDLKLLRCSGAGLTDKPQQYTFKGPEFSGNAAKAHSAAYTEDQGIDGFTDFDALGHRYDAAVLKLDLKERKFFNLPENSCAT